ncbi:replication restart DNA helicase PriA [Marinobacter sp. LV10R520-4]|uniref:Z1 domain-containing protein n=1 Tax=Marinobacter sp. LV10R520-4 TaxID=1761796 RepID=UPI000BF83CDF|nr:Z1 domain-containing protein [Marinobacter sp. LV10R520-4]PFG53245.1 replication restart DNA helicase PriA [Marinobacter sp. LV10R520-4]
MKWKDIVGDVGSNQYNKRIASLKEKGLYTDSIENTVDKTIENIKSGNGRSFVIFGEPQSGKTEMMIALNARLLDEGNGIIINLLTDSIDLLGQSLDRFRESGLSPSPKQFSDLPSERNDLKGKKWLIFSKKNARDLEKLIDLISYEKNVVVIDDEADYASPNAKVNKDEKTKINQLICKLIGNHGQYIGVTATPARLNLNNTFKNESELWVDFPPHPKYVGQEFFFPESGKVDYRLHTFHADEGSERVELQSAVLHFLCGVAEQHEQGNEENFTMLIHTSGKKDEHQDDVQVIQKTLATLSNGTDLNFSAMTTKLENIAREYAVNDSDSLVEFVMRNINRHMIVEINSRGASGGVSKIAKPTSLFSFGAGGNIISRGVTFDNLLSMYFTRSVKGKFSQDTYIQRARMFGSRENYKNCFQLWIPGLLLGNWSKCFSFHKLAIQAMRSKSGAPVWLADHKTTPTSAASIDKSTVDFEGGEMSFALFDFSKKRHETLFLRDKYSDLEMLEKLRRDFSKDEFPEYLYRYLKQQITYNPDCRLSFHKPSKFGTGSGAYDDEEKKTIRRKKGIFSNNEFSRSERPEALHHLKIFNNEYGNARLFYKINGSAIKFMQNRK